MLDFVHIGGWDIAASPVGQELRRLGVAHRFLLAPVNRRYKSRLELLFRIYPLIAVKVLVAATRSMWQAGSAPDGIIVSSDIEALTCALVRSVLRRRTLVVLQTLIITPRGNRLANSLYLGYWRLILWAIDVGICHARSEVATYSKLFPWAAHKLIFIPYGTTVSRRSELIQEVRPDEGVPLVVTAGRSGRDYPLLARAVEGLNCRLIIVCDMASFVADVPRSEQVEIVRDCFETDYMRMLARATVVAVPLSAIHISAGQMVLLHAASLARAVVITRTETTVDYAADGENALMVEAGDGAALRNAVERLLQDAALRARLGADAAARYDRDHTTEAYVRFLVSAVSGRVSARGVRSVT